MINADYYGRQGLVIIKKRDVITLSNPGGFRIDVEAAKSGGISDPCNDCQSNFCYKKGDSKDMKKGYSSKGLFGTINHYDDKGKKVGHSSPTLFGGYLHEDED